ncbi:MAG: type II secretion system ATPase GspE [Bryobacteraceae bacterium]
MRLGEILIERRQLQPEDLDRGLELQKERGDKLGKILIDLGFIAQRDLLAALSSQLDLPLASLDQPPPVTPETERLAPRFLRQSRIFPLSVDEGVLCLAMADPLDFETLSAVRACTGLTVRPFLSSELEIHDALEKYYEEAEKPAESLIEGGPDQEDLEHLRDMASEAPVIRLVNTMIAQAVEKRASDIHIEPFEKEFRIRFRIDGVLFNQDMPPRDMKAAITSRLKLMAKLNIAERRLPQDGRIKVKTLGREVDLRVSTLPTLYGESVVMRLLDRSAGDFYDLRRLGFDEHMLSRMEHFTSLPHGIFMVTGPTGSGKSTTLYSALKRINIPDRKIITIEDPVEYQMDGINQIHVNPQIGLTFASGLRHIVRQDPDVIMVGEIRDVETARVAIQAALTGHLVLSTLHTNSAPGAFTRLMNMGAEPYLLATAINGVVAQRLARKICPHCRTSYFPSESALSDAGWVGDSSRVFFKGEGCGRCHDSGFLGRAGIYEILEVTDPVREALQRGVDEEAIRRLARRDGWRPLREEGLRMVQAGFSTLEEVLRVTHAESEGRTRAERQDEPVAVGAGA